MKKPVSNNKKHTIYVGDIGIPPGQSRMVDAQYLPPEPDEDESEPAPDPVRELLDLGAKDIIAAVEADDAEFSADLLDAAVAAEEAKKNRSTVIAALKAAHLAAKAAEVKAAEEADADAAE